MAKVHDDNAKRKLEAAKRQARLAHAAHEFFRASPQGQELFQFLEQQAGSKHPAFSAREGWNPHGAAFRDGMRATFLIIENLIKEYEETHGPEIENQR